MNVHSVRAHRSVEDAVKAKVGNRIIDNASVAVASHTCDPVVADRSQRGPMP